MINLRITGQIKYSITIMRVLYHNPKLVGKIYKRISNFVACGFSGWQAYIYKQLVNQTDSIGIYLIESNKTYFILIKVK